MPTRLPTWLRRWVGTGLDGHDWAEARGRLWLIGADEIEQLQSGGDGLAVSHESVAPGFDDRCQDRFPHAVGNFAKRYAV